MKCRHGRWIKEVWWECANCVSEDGYSEESIRKMQKEHDKQMWEYRSRELREWERNKPQREYEEAWRNYKDKKSWARTKIIASIILGILSYFIVGFGGCIVRVGMQDWSKDALLPLHAYICEALFTFLLIFGIGIFSAIRTMKGVEKPRRL